MITEVTKLLGIQYPVIQGGMAWHFNLFDLWEEQNER